MIHPPDLPLSPPTRRFLVRCRCDQETLLGEVRDLDRFPGHGPENGDWTLIGLRGQDHGPESAVLKCQNCGRHYERSADRLARQWEAEGAPENLLL